MQVFTTIADVVTYYVAPALADHADDFDLDAIAHDVATWSNSPRGFVIDEDGFWAAVAAHDLTA